MSRTIPHFSAMSFGNLTDTTRSKCVSLPHTLEFRHKSSICDIGSRGNHFPPHLHVAHRVPSQSGLFMLLFVSRHCLFGSDMSDTLSHRS